MRLDRLTHFLRNILPIHSVHLRHICCMRSREGGSKWHGARSEAFLAFVKMKGEVDFNSCESSRPIMMHAVVNHPTWKSEIERNCAMQ